MTLSAAKALFEQAYSWHVQTEALGQLERGSIPGAWSRWWIHLQRGELLRIGVLSTRLRGATSSPAHLAYGKRGELEALFFLRQQGLKVISRRWRSPEHNGDLDLVAWERDTLCFVEVKARTERDLTPAASAVDSHKRKMLSGMASAYLRTLPQTTRADIKFRFDIVSVYLLASGVECELLRDAFPWQGGNVRKKSR